MALATGGLARLRRIQRQGIGRPSTYAATIGTIERRGYVFRQGKALVPSFTAFAVTRLLRGHFGDLVDVVHEHFESAVDAAVVEVEPEAADFQ